MRLMPSKSRYLKRIVSANENLKYSCSDDNEKYKQWRPSIIVLSDIYIKIIHEQHKELLNIFLLCRKILHMLLGGN